MRKKKRGDPPFAVTARRRSLSGKGGRRNPSRAQGKPFEAEGKPFEAQGKKPPLQKQKVSSL